MNSQYRHETDLDDLRDTAEPSREISLGTATILGIFLALALVCAAFFAFGYSLGRRSAPALAATSDNPAALTVGGVKPAPGSAAALKSKPADPDTDSTTQNTPAERMPAQPSTSAAVPLDTQLAAPVQPPATRPPAAATASTRPTPAPSASGAAATATEPIVQVAAVSHQEDADILLSALKRRGYNVAIRHEPQDKLMHVQIGPFASKKEAESMRQKLLADGYNAIVK